MSEQTNLPVHNENSTIHGLARNELIWNPTFKAKCDTKGKWTGSESFTCRLKDVTRVIPSLRSQCQMEGFTFLTFTEVEIENIEGDLAEVTCAYSSYNDTQISFDENNLDNYIYDLQIQLSEEPIQTFYKFNVDNPISSNEWMIIKNFIAGVYSVKKDSDGYTFVMTGDNDEEITIGTVSTDQAKKLVDYIAKGQDGFLKPSQVWRVSYTSLSRPSASKLNDVGKIKDPPGAPELAGDRNWLFQGLSVQQSDRVYTITEEYLLSDLGGWDQYIYGTSE